MVCSSGDWKPMTVTYHFKSGEHGNYGLIVSSVSYDLKFLIKPVEALNNSVTCFVTYLALWF